MPKPEVDELTLLKERADNMGIGYHPSIGAEKLKEKIKTKLDDAQEGHKGTKRESKAQRNLRLRKEANALVRVRLTCMNPAKKNWPGEVFSASNSAIGWIKKFIPFEAEDGWHVPKILLSIIKNKKYASFYTMKVNGKTVKRSRLVKEFAVEVLSDLSVEDLKDLAARQALNQSVDV